MKFQAPLDPNPTFSRLLACARKFADFKSSAYFPNGPDWILIVALSTLGGCPGSAFVGACEQTGGTVTITHGEQAAQENAQAHVQTDSSQGYETISDDSMVDRRSCMHITLFSYSPEFAMFVVPLF